jgi:hypothetical protein
MICRRMDASESRLAAKRVCKTAAQWRDDSRADGGVERSRRDGAD